MITVKQAKLADNPKIAAALAHIQAALTGDTSTGLVYLPPKKKKEKPTITTVVPTPDIPALQVTETVTAPKTGHAVKPDWESPREKRQLPGLKILGTVPMETIDPPLREKQVTPTFSRFIDHKGKLVGEAHYLPRCRASAHNNR